MTSTPDQINRHRERARHERQDLDDVLDAEHNVGTLSTVIKGKPWVVPMLYARVGDRILLHGSVGAGALRHVSAGAPAALSVTFIDGWFTVTRFSTPVRTTAQQLCTVGCSPWPARKPRRR
jgi:nitroimidazol reductase NimA-like FMN-containing flavoprotein (pyridoxamine 5'-phosphate oxidase superfamily)